jgi:curli biogenesis system outer membrane secretion channel CsgG
VKRALATVVVTLLAAALVACSPEASRTRNGGPGADIGNHSPSLPEPSTPPPIPAG